MPPDQTSPSQPAEPDEPTNLPPTPLVSGPVISQPAGLAKKLPLKLIAVVVAVVVLLGGGGVYGYGYYKTRSATSKFNDLAKRITEQEKDGAANYVKASAIIDEFSQLLSASTNATSAPNSDKLNAKLDTLKTLVDDSCKAKSSDVTAASIDKDSSGLKLSATQKQYLSDWKQVVNGLEDADYSNTGMCRDGQVYVSFTKAFVSFVPGLDVVDNLGDDLTKVNSDQLKQLKALSQLSIADQDKLQAALPETTNFLNDLKSLVGSLYDTILAAQKNDSAGAAQAERSLLQLSGKIDSDSTAMTDEMNAFDKKINDAAVAASKAELSGIEYQKNHNVTNANMQLDTNLPAFRITEAATTSYSDKHDGAYPHAASIDGLADVDSSVKDLKDKGYLKDFSYASSGNDDSGFTLKVKLSDGTVLEEMVTPTTQSA